MKWSIDLVTSTAVYGADYLADGATLNFMPGETRKCKISGLDLGGLFIMKDLDRNGAQWLRL